MMGSRQAAQTSVALIKVAGVPGIWAGSKGGPMWLAAGAWPLDRP